MLVAEGRGAVAERSRGAAQVEKQRAALPRGDIAAEALSHSYVVEVDSKETACKFSNLVGAPQDPPGRGCPPSNGVAPSHQTD